MNIQESLTSFQNVFRASPGIPFAWARQSHLISGFETRSHESYLRDVRLKNPKESWDRHIAFQYTFSGEGILEENGVMHRLTPGTAFIIPVPSPHRYYLPKSGKPWTFAYMAITHPYVVERLAEIIAETSTVWRIECERNLIQSAFRMITMHYERAFADEFAEEHALLAWMLEFARFARQNSRTFDIAEKLLTDIRSQVLDSLPDAVDVPKLAASYGMSRSNFSHYFKRLTGISPGHYMRELRLQYAADLLRQSNHPAVKTIAAQCGFPDAARFTKLFQSRFQVTPSKFGRILS